MLYGLWRRNLLNRDKNKKTNKNTRRWYCIGSIEEVESSLGGRSLWPSKAFGSHIQPLFMMPLSNRSFTVVIVFTSMCEESGWPLHTCHSSPSPVFLLLLQAPTSHPQLSHLHPLRLRWHPLVNVLLIANLFLLSYFLLKMHTSLNTIIVFALSKY